MRILIGLVIVGAVIGGIVTHRNREASPAPVVVERATVSRQTSQHDWAKSALDRTGEVRRQVAEQRKQNEAH